MEDIREFGSRSLACFLLLSRPSSGEIEQIHENTWVGWPETANTVSGHYCYVSIVNDTYDYQASWRSCNEVFIHYLTVTLGHRIF